MSENVNFELDTIVCGDCLDVMRDMPDGCVDLVVTSPPYWNLKNYSHWEKYTDYIWDIHRWIEQLWRILKDGRHVLWNCMEKLPNPAKTNGTGERLYYRLAANTEAIAMEYGFIVEPVIIWKKPNKNNQKMFGSYPYPPTMITDNTTELVLHFRKAGKPIVNKKNKSLSQITKQEWVEWATDLWEFSIDIANPHPASFPMELPKRCIKLWCCANELIFDPFIGSGTTAVAAMKLGRHFYGCDINPEYVRLANERIEKTRLELSQLELAL